MRQQLCSLLEKLRSVEATTSDSGAVSDYSENADCKSHSLTSLDLEENDSYQHSKAMLGVNNKGHSSLEGEKFTNTATEVSIEIQGKLTQPKEEQLPATENTFCELESEQPSSVTIDCDKSGDQVTDSTKKNAGEQLVKIAKEIIENKRETVSDEQVRIRRKTRRHCGHGYSNWRRNCGYYDNSRSRNSHHDNSRNRGRQQTSSLSDPKLQKQSSFDHEEVAAFLWNSKTN